MKKKRTFKEKLAYTIERVEDSAKVSVLLISIFLGIGLVIVTGLAGRIYRFILPAKGNATRYVIIAGRVPLLWVVITLSFIGTVGMIIGEISYILCLFVYFWFKE